MQQEPQRVTMKDPKKVEADRDLAASNHKKREVKKREEQVQSEKSGVNQYYSIGVVIAVGGDRWPWLLHLSNQATFTWGRAATPYSIE